MSSYNYWSQNPAQMQQQYQYQSPSCYFRDQTNTQYGSYNGQPFAMFPSTTPASVTSNSSFSSGYGSDISPSSIYQTTPHSNSSSQWYQQPLAKKTKQTSPDTENIIRQIFQTPEPVVPSKATKKTVAKKPHVTAQSTATTANTDFDLDNLECFDLDEYGYDDEDEENEEESLAGGTKKTKRVLTKSQREAANIRERKRMNIMNEAFVNLKQALPHKTGRKRRKMSRLDIVCGALEYIDYLDNKLTNTTGPIELNFEAYQNSLDFF